MPFIREINVRPFFSLTFNLRTKQRPTLLGGRRIVDSASSLFFFVELSDHLVPRFARQFIFIVEFFPREWQTGVKHLKQWLRLPMRSLLAIIWAVILFESSRWHGRTE
jgi:hypothetical protein